jgi:hypothetical protein
MGAKLASVGFIVLAIGEGVGLLDCAGTSIATPCLPMFRWQITG